MFRGVRDRFDDLRPGERLAPDLDLGSSDYIFRSDRGTDYQFIPVDDDYAGVQFTAPSGALVQITFWPAREDGRGRGWLFDLTIDNERLSGPLLSSAEGAPRPIRELVRNAIADVNAESRARRERQRDVFERAGAATPDGPESMPLHQLRGDFDLGPDDYDFVSERGWNYEYWTEKPKESAAVRFSAPSGADVFLTLEPQVSTGLREVRIRALIDDVRVSDSALLTVQQFPPAIQQLIGDAIADLNRESEDRLARTDQTLYRAGQRSENDWPNRR